MSYEDRIESEAQSTRCIKNDDMACKTCKFVVTVRDDICVYYPHVKLGSVLSGGECPEYVKGRDI